MKYAFNKQLKKYSSFRVPLNRFTIALSGSMLGALYFLRRQIKGVTAKRIKIPALCAEDGRKNPLSALLYSPKGAKNKNLPCVLFLHGGGFVFRAASHHFAMAERIALKTGCKVLFLDYRTAPKHKFPAAVFDAISAYKWILSEGEKHGILTKNIVAVGDSAGGNLAAALSIAAKERGLPMPKAQVLLYPVLDGRMQTESMKQFIDTPMCNSRDIKKYYSYYAPNIAADEKYISPGLLKDFSFLPPTYIEVAEFDCLRDEGLSYAAALKKCGVETAVTEVKGAMHGYDIAKNSPLVKDLAEKRVAFLKEHIFK